MNEKKQIINSLKKMNFLYSFFSKINKYSLALIILSFLNIIFSIFSLLVSIWIIEEKNIKFIIFIEGLFFTFLLIVKEFTISYKYFLNEILIFLFFQIFELNTLVFCLLDLSFITLLIETILRLYLNKNSYNRFLKGLIIYYYLSCLDNYGLIYYFVPNNLRIICYVTIKVSLIFLSIIRSSSTEFNLLNNVNSGIIVFDINMKLIFQNTKFKELILDFGYKEEVFENPQYFLEDLFSLIKKDDFDVDLQNEIKGFYNLIAFTKLEYKIDKEVNAFEIKNMCEFFANYKDYFENFKRIFNLKYDKEKIRFNSYELYFKIYDGNYYFLINEHINYNAIQEINNLKGKCLAKIAHDFKTPLKAIDKYCQELKELKISSSSKLNEFNYSHISSKSSSFKKKNFIQAMGNYVLSLVDNLNIITNGIFSII